MTDNQILDRYKYDITKEETSELNNVVVTDDYINSDIWKKITTKLKNTKSRYIQKYNDDTKPYTVSLLYFCTNEHVNLLNDTKNNLKSTYSKYDERIENLTYFCANKLYEYIINEYRKDDGDKIYNCDIVMKNLIDSQPINNAADYFIYHRTRTASSEIKNLFDNKILSIDILVNICKNELNMLKMNIEQNKYEECTNNIYCICSLIEKRIDILNEHDMNVYTEKFIKSDGEKNMLIVLIIMVGVDYLINSQPLINPQTGKPLEIDFYIYNDSYAIEIDGGYHQDAEQRKRDSIKKYLCESQNIYLDRIDTTLTKSNYIKNMFNIVNTYLSNHSIYTSITADIIDNIIKTFDENYKADSKYKITPTNYSIQDNINRFLDSNKNTNLCNSYMSLNQKMLDIKPILKEKMKNNDIIKKEKAKKTTLKKNKAMHEEGINTNIKEQAIAKVRKPSTKKAKAIIEII